jgi:Zn-dependent protease with chaperone function
MLRVLIPAIFLALFVWLVRATLASFRPRDEAEDDGGLPDLPERMDAESLAAWMHQRLVDAYALEQPGWALERAARVEERFYAGVPVEDRLRTVVLWIPEVTAFTLGRHVYLSRHLLERVTTDDAVAFVVAHELGHHALGHQDARERWIDRFAGVPAGGLIAATIIEGMRWRHSPEQELDADAYALRLCAQSGYDLAACLRVLDVLEADALDRGALSAVYGPEPEDVDDAEPGAGEKVRRWFWERERGYPSLLERRARLDELAHEMAGPGV